LFLDGHSHYDPAVKLFASEVRILVPIRVTQEDSAAEN
jgi:hypothetical protein